MKSPGQRRTAHTPRHRFYVPASERNGTEIGLSAATAHQLRQVLRLKKGDSIVVFHGDGDEHVVRLETLGRAGGRGQILETRHCTADPRVAVTLYQALLPRERFEQVVQKGTEVGISFLVPLVTERCQSRGRSATSERLQRWRRIAQEATEQCGRSRVPEVRPFVDLQAALSQSGSETALIAWEGERQRSVRAALSPVRRRARLASVSLLAGPEGGFTMAEVEQSVAAGALTVSLGPRTLRSETAGPLLAALVLHELGELEPPR